MAVRRGPWLYTATFRGHYPVGTAAVVIAGNIGEARDMLEDALKERGLEQPRSEIEVKSVPIKKAVHILADGNY